jgi:hypothetical protein
MATTHEWQRLGNQLMDSRDLIAVAEEIENTEPEDREDKWEETLEAINAIADDVSEWQYGATLIREDYFEEYAQQLAEDIGAIGRDATWPLSHIDWPAAAEALLIDYSEVKFMGHTYYVRD